MDASAFHWPEGESPVEEIKDPLFANKGITVHVKRDDLLQPFPGNKARKLKYAYAEYVDSGCRGIITLGGPFSNHIHAFSRLCTYFRIPGKVLLRGEADDPHNPVLREVRNAGVEIIPVTRARYAMRYSTAFADWVTETWPDHFLIPEGGASEAGMRGCTELGQSLISDRRGPPDIVLVAAGTGTTAVGMTAALPTGTRVIAISALREKIIGTAIEKVSAMRGSSLGGARFELNTDYNFGGFAKWDDRLIRFVNDFRRSHGITLDPVYNGKVFFGLFDLIHRDQIPNGSRIVVIHTGGMPGRAGFNYRFPGLLEGPF